MSAESVLVAFAREGVEMVLASIAKANETEKAEIKAMLDETRARLDAIPPLAAELDAITEKHLARVRAKTAEHEAWTAVGVASLTVKDAVTAGAFGPKSLDGATALGWDGAPVEGEDPDE